MHYILLIETMKLIESGQKEYISLYIGTYCHFFNLQFCDIFQSNPLILGVISQGN